jgi:hypothetical protein
MTFATDRFKEIKYSPRTKTVAMEQLKQFFDPEEKPEFIIRGLTAEEICYCSQAAKGYSQVEPIMLGMLGESPSAKLEAILLSLGISKNMPEDYAKRIEHFMLGCIQPVSMDREVAVKLSLVVPVEFLYITNEILRLSGIGAELLGE